MIAAARLPLRSEPAKSQFLLAAGHRIAFQQVIEQAGQRRQFTTDGGAGQPACSSWARQAKTYARVTVRNSSAPVSPTKLQKSARSPWYAGCRDWRTIRRLPAPRPGPGIPQRLPVAHYSAVPGRSSSLVSCHLASRGGMTSCLETSLIWEVIELGFHLSESYETSSR